MINTKKILLSIALFTAIATQTFSQENVLDPITVVSSVAPIAASQTGRNITVIKGEQLTKQPIQSIDDLLKYLPGVEVQQRGPMGAQADISIRGGTYQQVLVVLDGIRLNDPLTGHFSSYIPISPAEIDRIEVLYGASSAIYGTEAVGGVINIITKSFNQKNKHSNQLQAQATVGQFGLVGLQVGGLYSKGNQTIAGGVLSNQTYGQPQRGTDGYVHTTTGSLSYSNKLSKYFSLALRTAYDDRNFSAQNFYTAYTSDTAFEKVKTHWNHLQLTYEKEGKKLSIDAGYKAVSDYYKFNAGLAANENKSSLFQSQIVYSQKINSSNAATFGTQFIQKNITSNDRGNHSINEVAAFALWQTQVGKHLFLNPAVRYDYSEGFGSKLVAQMNTSIKMNKAQLRASVGNTIRDADFTERYNNYGKSMLKYGSIGNANLNAEQSLSYEFGVDYWLQNNWKFTASWFQRNQSDLIDWVSTPYANMPRKDNLDTIAKNGVYALASNISKVNTAGLELTTQYNKTWSKQNLLGVVSAIWMRSRSADASSNNSFYLNAQATFLFNYNLQYSYKNWSIALNGLYKERLATIASGINATVSPSYFLLNTKASYTLPKKHISIFVEANNLLNRSYADLLGSPMPNRWLMGGLQLRW